MGWKHSAVCDGSTGSTSTGGADAQTSVARQHRVLKRQPDGGFNGEGISPDKIIRCPLLAWSKDGAADIGAVA